MALKQKTGYGTCVVSASLVSIIGQSKFKAQLAPRGICFVCWIPGKEGGGVRSHIHTTLRVIGFGMVWRRDDVRVRVRVRVRIGVRVKVRVKVRVGLRLG